VNKKTTVSCKGSSKSNEVLLDKIELLISV